MSRVEFQKAVGLNKTQFERFLQVNEEWKNRTIEPSKRELLSVCAGSGRKPFAVSKEISDALMDLFVSARGPREHDDIPYG